MQIEALAAAAREARRRAYCPYSRYAVGAALLSADGEIFTGCNIENATQGPGICAERTALYKAVSEGVREFAAIAVAGGPADGPEDPGCAPCGVCRQALAEFCRPDLVIILAGPEGCRVYTLGEIFPFAFRLEK